MRLLTELHRRRLLFWIIVLIGITIVIGLILYALRQNLNLFYTPHQIHTQRISSKARIRIGGYVKPGSIQKTQDLQMKFVVTDHLQEVEVHYAGILPDLFREGQGVVATGYLNERKALVADNILAKHDEKYVSPKFSTAP